MKDKELQLMKEKSLDYLDIAKSQEIVFDCDADIANNIAAEIQKAIKITEEKRRFYVQPIQEAAKRINSDFKPISEMLDKALFIIKEKLLVYVRSKREREQVEQKEKEGILNDIVDLKSEEVKGQLRSEGGVSYITKTWQFKIVDFSAIPDSYKLVNEKMIRELIKENTKTIGGVTTMDLKINGVEFYQQERLGIRGAK